MVHIIKFYNFKAEKYSLETSDKKITSHNPKINRYYFAILTKCFRRKHLATKGLLSLCTHSLRNHNVILNGVKDLLIIHSLCARPVVVLSVCTHPHLVSWVSRSFGLSTTRQCHAELVEASPRSRPATTYSECHPERKRRISQFTRGSMVVLPERFFTSFRMTTIEIDTRRRDHTFQFSLIT